MDWNHYNKLGMWEIISIEYYSFLISHKGCFLTRTNKISEIFASGHSEWSNTSRNFFYKKSSGMWYVCAGIGKFKLWYLDFAGDFKSILNRWNKYLNLVRKNRRFSENSLNFQYTRKNHQYYTHENKWYFLLISL